jgi:hypothetical protein
MLRVSRVSRVSRVKLLRKTTWNLGMLRVSRVGRVSRVKLLRKRHGTWACWWCGEGRKQLY